MTFELTPVSGAENEVDLSRLEVEISALDGRETVDGLEDLEVGKPIFAKRSLGTNARLRLDETRVVDLPSGSKARAILALRVHRMDRKEEE